MSRHVIVVFLFAVAGRTGVMAQTKGLVTESALPTSSLTIRGSTTIGASWHCTAREITARAEVIATGAFTLDVIRQVFVSVPVWKLRCQSGPMERAMRRAMRAEHDTASAIVGLFWPHEPALPLEPGTGPHLHGSLTVAGVQRDVRLDLHLEQHGSDTLHVASSLPLTLSAFAITPPRVLFGAVRARDAITVNVDLRFPAPAAGAEQR
jgi:hypothetical protein